MRLNSFIDDFINIICKLYFLSLFLNCKSTELTWSIIYRNYWDILLRYRMTQLKNRLWILFLWFLVLISRSSFQVVGDCLLACLIVLHYYYYNYNNNKWIYQVCTNQKMSSKGKEKALSKSMNICRKNSKVFRIISLIFLFSQNWNHHMFSKAQTWLWQKNNLKKYRL